MLILLTSSYAEALEAACMLFARDGITATITEGPDASWLVQLPATATDHDWNAAQKIIEDLHSEASPGHGYILEFTQGDLQMQIVTLGPETPVIAPGQR